MNGEAKLSHKAATGTALHFSSDLMSLVSLRAWHFLFPGTRKAHHSALTTAQLLHAAPLDINEMLPGLPVLLKSGELFPLTPSDRAIKATQGHKTYRWAESCRREESSSLDSEVRMLITQHGYAARSWQRSLMKVLLGMLRLLPCSAGPKQHQERKEQKALLHHWANLKCPMSWTLHAVPVLHAQKGDDPKC